MTKKRRSAAQVVLLGIPRLGQTPGPNSDEVVVGVDTGRRVDGWVVPWLPDVSMDALQHLYTNEDQPDAAPHMTVAGTWVARVDEEDVELRRRRMLVAGSRVPVTDVAPLGFCWVIVGRPADYEARARGW